MGFGVDDTEDDSTLYADTALGVSDEPASATDSTPREATDDNDSLPEMVFDAARRDKIFTLVVEEFNKALPEFLSKAVDPGRQRRQLLEKLDEDLKNYIESLSELARLHSESMWKERQNQLTAQLEAVRQRAEEIERQSADIRQKQLSADRQKRALTDRTHDLETQLARSESEREQFELENRSLVNRLKVAAVMQEDNEKLRAEIDELKRRLFLNADPAGAEGTDFKACDEELLKQTETLKEEAGKAREEAEAAKKESEELLARLIAEQEKSVGVASELDETKKQLATTSTELEEYRNVIDNLGKLEETLTSQDKKIKSQRSRISSLEEEIANLNKILAENQARAEEREKHLREELKALRPPTVVDEMQIHFDVVNESEVPRITEDDLTAMQESFENGEWFTHNEPAPTPSMRNPEAEAEFGYRAPRRKPSPADNPNQLSLF